MHLLGKKYNLIDVYCWPNNNCDVVGHLCMGGVGRGNKCCHLFPLTNSLQLLILLTWNLWYGSLRLQSQGRLASAMICLVSKTHMGNFMHIITHADFPDFWAVGYSEVIGNLPHRLRLERIMFHLGDKPIDCACKELCCAVCAKPNISFVLKYFILLYLCRK